MDRLQTSLTPPNTLGGPPAGVTNRRLYRLPAPLPPKHPQPRSRRFSPTDAMYLLLLLFLLLPTVGLADFTYTTSGSWATITGYEGTPPAALTIPDTITDSGNPYQVNSIQFYAFQNCSELTSVAIPASVTSIGFHAFYGCTSLTSISVDAANPDYSSEGGVLFDKLRTLLIQYPLGVIGSYTVPEGVTSIVDSAFSGCIGLTSVAIPTSVTSIVDSAFSGCIGLTGVAIPARVISIGNNAFYGCSGLTSVVITDGVTSLGSFVFAGCSGLTSVAIPSSVTSIGFNAFSGNRMMTSISVDAANPNYCSAGGVLFDKVRTLLIQYPLGEIGSYTVPEGVTSIGNYAFFGCIGLTSVAIPSSVTSIGNNAFQGCSGLTSVAIPASVTSIGNYVFSGSGVTSIVVDAANPNYSSAGGVLFNKLRTLLIQCSIGVRGSYTVPDGVTSIGNNAFQGCSGLTSVAIPSSVASIGDSAFGNCIGLMNVVIPASVTSIGNHAFQGCSGLIRACFLGDAPSLIMFGLPFMSVANGFAVYYFDGKTGFTSPTWMGYPAVNMGDATSVATWLLMNGFPYNADLQADPNGDGVNLLTAYAFNLDPNKNLSGTMPRPAFAGNQMNLTFYAGNPDVSYTAETSNDLINWGTEGVTVSVTDGTGMRTATVPMSDQNRFLRLVLSH